MKTHLPYFPLLIALFGFCFQTQAQPYSVEQHVFSTAGNSNNVGAFQIDWTIGEPFVESLRGSRKQLTQGFHQTLLERQSTYIFSILDHDNFRHFSVFPNPFRSDFSVQWNFSENLNLLFEIYTLEGKRIFSKRQNAMDSALFIQLSNLKPSIYILRISDPLRNFFETHKLVKL